MPKRAGGFVVCAVPSILAALRHLPRKGPDEETVVKSAKPGSRAHWPTNTRRLRQGSGVTSPRGFAREDEAGDLQSYPPLTKGQKCVAEFLTYPVKLYPGTCPRLPFRLPVRYTVSRLGVIAQFAAFGPWADQISRCPLTIQKTDP